MGTNKQIRWASTTGTGINKAFDLAAGSNATDLCVHESLENIYWVDLDSGGCLLYNDYDETGTFTLIDTNLPDASSISVNEDVNMLFWIDQTNCNIYSGTIGSISNDSDDHILSISDVNLPQGIDIYY